MAKSTIKKPFKKAKAAIAVGNLAELQHILSQSPMSVDTTGTNRQVSLLDIARQHNHTHIIAWLEGQAV